MPLGTQSATTSRSVEIPPVGLVGDLVIPAQAKGIVIFAHGSGSSRFSSRNRAVARDLQQSGLATLLMDLLTSEEEQLDLYTGHLRFDIRLLAERLVEAADWISEISETSALPVGYFGASTGGGAALVAAADRPERVKAVVSRGGRPDLAKQKLGSVKAPTLLIVGGRDEQVIEVNREAFEQLRCEKRLEIVPAAGHLFGEAGTLQEVSRLAADWFSRHLSRTQAQMF